MTDRSRLAELLGIDEDEEYTVKGDNDIVYRIHNGERQYKNLLGGWRSVCSEYSLVALINDPSLIVRKPRFSDEEMTFLRLLHKYGKVTRISEHHSVFYDCTRNGKFMISNIGESLNINKTIDLDEMFKEGTDND